MTIKDRYKDLQRSVRDSQHWINYVSASWDYDGNWQAYQIDRDRHDRIIANAKAEMKRILDKYPEKLI